MNVAGLVVSVILPGLTVKASMNCSFHEDDPIRIDALALCTSLSTVFCKEKEREWLHKLAGFSIKVCLWFAMKKVQLESLLQSWLRFKRDWDCLQLRQTLFLFAESSWENLSNSLGVGTEFLEHSMRLSWSYKCHQRFIKTKVKASQPVINSFQGRQSVEVLPQHWSSETLSHRSRGFKFTHDACKEQTFLELWYSEMCEKVNLGKVLLQSFGSILIFNYIFKISSHYVFCGSIYLKNIMMHWNTLESFW